MRNIPSRDRGRRAARPGPAGRGGRHRRGQGPDARPSGRIAQFFAPVVAARQGRRPADQDGRVQRLAPGQDGGRGLAAGSIRAPSRRPASTSWLPTRPMKTQATASEVALAGKGFNKQVEDSYKAKNPQLNFAAVDRMLQVKVGRGPGRGFPAPSGKLGPLRRREMSASPPSPPRPGRPLRAPGRLPPTARGSAACSNKVNRRSRHDQARRPWKRPPRSSATPSPTSPRRRSTTSAAVWPP